MNLILFSTEQQKGMYPLTFMKPAAELRMGILTFTERCEKILGAKASFLTDDYLAEKFTLTVEDDNLFLNPLWVPTQEIWDTIKKLDKGTALVNGEKLIAYRGSKEDFDKKKFAKTLTIDKLEWVSRPYHLFHFNAEALEFDFALLTDGKKSQPISNTNGVISPERIFLEEGAKVEYAILNASSGSIYIGKDAEICEGSMVRGGLALCEHAKLNLGTKIYGATTIGPWSKVGGEVNNSIMTAYSNKGHDGFLGNSVIGEWCNLGADTNNSNLKNNYGEVKLWDYETGSFEKTGLQFCGLMMGDHAKSAINTQFNTGTVVEPFANVFTSGFPPNLIKAFSWGGKKDAPKFRLEAAYEVAERMMGRRGVPLSEADRRMIVHLFDSL